MKFLPLYWILMMTTMAIYGQEDVIVVDTTKTIDVRYREDQFYAGFTFNVLFNRPLGIKQTGFSGGVHLGFIRDMPVNKRRNVAVGLGLGYSGNIYNQNLGITEVEGREFTVFEALDADSFDSNRFTTHLIEVPLEFRWRTSTPNVLKFWRVYTGMRLGYLYAFKSTLRRNGDRFIKTVFDELDRLRLGATFTFGWNTFNFHFYYSLNSFFNDNASLSEGVDVGVNTLKIGLLFYIL